jgi:hypothetical protein
MPLITDPDNLNQGTEVVFDTAAKTIGLAVAGNLSNDGVTLKALYSFCKEEWKDDANLIKFPFPFIPITDESFELVEGWDFLDTASESLIRTAGWRVVNTSGVVTRIRAGIISLGAVEGDDAPYLNMEGPVSPEYLTTTFNGPVNESFLVYADPAGTSDPTINRRNDAALYVREQGQLYSSASLSSIGASNLAAQVYRFPLNTGPDLKITHSDAQIDADAPYTGMSIIYHTVAQDIDIGGTNRQFGITIDANNGTAEQVYEFVQRQLRRTTTIGVGNPDQGVISDELLEFVGDNLKTKQAKNPAGGGTGVYITNFQTADVNRLTFVDNGGTERIFPFSAALTLNFNPNLRNDASAIYRVFYSTGFASAGAVLVQDGTGSDMAGDVLGQSSVTLTFAYDTNNDNGRTPGTPVPVTVVAIGLETGQYVLAEGVINRSASNAVSLVAPLERNYENE